MGVIYALDGACEIRNISDDILLEKINNGVWVHTTYVSSPKWGTIPANGIVVIDGQHAVVVDTPWTDRQTEILFDWIESNLNTKISHVIVTHSHEDCMGGLRSVHSRGITSYSLNMTRDIAARESKLIPKKVFSDKMKIKAGDNEIILSYFGGGHTKDNIVVWLPDHKLLFGGCLVKSLNSKSLGNIDEADIPSWPNTLREVLKAYPSVETVVPGHGRYGDSKLIYHTIQLCNEYLDRN